MRLLPTKAWLTGLLVLPLLLAACSSGQGNVTPGAQAPDFALTSLKGDTVSLKDFRGKAVLLNFWATWCPACREEMPILQAVYNERNPNAVAFLLIDIQEPQGVVEGFMKEMGLNMPVALDRDGRVTRSYGVRPIPTTLLLDRDGIVRFVQIGAFSSPEELRARLTMVLPP